MKKNRTKNNSAFSLVEVLISASIIGVSIIAILNAYTFFIKNEIGINKKIQVIYSLEEGIEAMRHIRDKGWTNISGLSTTTTYYLSLSTQSGIADWQTTTTRQVSNNIERKITVANVYRDANSYDISATGTPDTNTEKITVSIIWPDQYNSTSTKVFSTYLTKN